MTPLKSPWQVTAKILLIPAVIFTILAVGGFALPFGIAVHPVFIIHAAIWTLLALIFFALSIITKTRLSRLKETGDKYEGTIVDTIPLYGVNIMHYLTARVDCSYINDQQQKCLVRSHAYLFDGARSAPRTYRYNVALHLNTYTVHIYVNRNDPRDYAVEINKDTGEPIKADHDYR